MDQEQTVANVLAAAEGADPPVTDPPVTPTDPSVTPTEPAPAEAEAPPGFSAKPPIGSWRYRPGFDPDPSKTPLERLAAAFEDMAGCLLFLSVALMTLGVEALFNTALRVLGLISRLRVKQFCI